MDIKAKAGVEYGAAAEVELAIGKEGDIIAGSGTGH